MSELPKGGILLSMAWSLSCNNCGTVLCGGDSFCNRYHRCPEPDYGAPEYYDTARLTKDNLEHHVHGCPAVVDDGADSASVVSSVGEIGRVIAFNDYVEVIEFPINDGCDFVHQLPQRCDGETDGPIRACMKDPHVVGRERRTLTSMANARQRALDLASGSGKLVPFGVGEDMSGDDDWSYVADGSVRSIGARVHLNETRLPILLWGEMVVSRFVALQDGYASYGRRFSIPLGLESIPIADGVVKYKNIMKDFEHWGDIPEVLKTVPIKPCATESALPVWTVLKTPVLGVSIAAIAERRADVIHARTALAAGIKTKDAELIKSWLIDTGCGHDLVNRKDLKKIAAKLMLSLTPLTFNTANGKTKATQQAQLYCKELKEHLQPHVLESTPPVLSVGKRCMDMGYSFVWLQGRNPYFICPDGKIVELRVRDNIPYLMTGNEDCQPKDADNTQSIPCAVSPLAFPGVDDAAPPGEPEAAEVDTDDSAWESEEVDEAPNPKRDLKAEAKSIEHLLDHKVKNPHCDSCNRSTMKNKKSMRGAFKDEPTVWGELVTGDHLDSKRKNMVGFSGEKEAFTILDVFSGLRHIYPTASKDSVDTSLSIQHFAGDRTIKRFYSDNSGEINKACKSLEILRDGSQPGMPQTNSLAERNNQTIITKTIACLLEAGLPPCYWSFAGPCLCLLMNTDRSAGESAWFKTHGSEFPGLRLPLGCKVSFKPSPTKGEDSGKWDEMSDTGVFAGYRLHSGYKWKGEFLVWGLEEFVHADLSKKARNVHQKLGKPHITKRCILHNQTLSFPCKAVYEHLNCTLEGKIESDKRHSEVDHPTDPPPPFDEAVAQGGGLPPAPPPSDLVDAGDGQVAPVPPVPVPTFDPYPPVNAGSKGDTCIFRGVKGDLVKLDKNGRPYPVREDGFRLLKTTRPVGWEPDAWDTMRGFNRKPRPGAVVKVEPAPGVPIAGVDQAGGSSASGLDRSVDPPHPAAASVFVTTAAEDPVGTRCRFIESPNDMHAAVSDILESSVPTHVKNTQHGPCVPAVAACVVDCACAPVGIMGLLNSDDSLVTSWLAECKALAAPAVKDDSDDEIEIEDVADEDQEPPWVHWDRIAQEHNEYLKPSSDAAVAVAAAKGTVTTQLRDSDNDLVPAMPTVAHDKSNDFKANFQ